MSRFGAVLTVALALAAVLFAAIVLAITGKLTQPMATVFAAVCVPALGFIGFRYQKTLDREAEAVSEKRTVYIELIEEVHRIRREEVVEGVGELWGYDRVRDKLNVLAPDHVAETLLRHYLGIRGFLRHSNDEDLSVMLRNAEEEAFQRVLDAIRLDLEHSTSFLPSKALAEEIADSHK